MKILLIEDEDTTCEIIKDILEMEKYSLKIANTGREGLQSALDYLPSIIILDINLPDMNGLEICSKIRSNNDDFNNPAIIILTVESDQEKVRQGLISGADDYIKKPFDYFEFLLRIKAIQRRIEKEDKNIYIYDNISIDAENISVKEGTKNVNMKRREVELLIYLIINKGLILSRNKIMKEIWGRDYYEGDRVVDVTIRRIKEALPILEDMILNVRGIGYKLLKIRPFD